MVIGSGTYPINYIKSAYSYRLICSPSTIPIDGTGMLKGGVTSLPVTVSVAKSTDNTPSAAVTDEDGLSIAVTKVANTGGRVTVIAATDGRLTTEMPTKTFDIADSGLNAVASYEVVLYKLNENLEKVPVDNVGIPVVADGKGIVSANVYYYRYLAVNRPDISKVPTDPTKWTATTINELGILTNIYWVFSAVKVIYTTGEVAMTGIQLLGNGIDYATIVEVYANGDSQTAAPENSSFVESSSFVPEKGKWLWTASKTTYLGSTNVFFLDKVCVGYIGTDGTTVVGKDAELYDLTVSPTTIHCNADGVVLNADGTIRVTAAHYVGNVAKDLTADDGLYLSMTMLTEAGESEAIVSRSPLTGAAYTHTLLEAITTTATVINVTLERLVGGTYTVMRTTDVAITRDGRSGDRGATGAMTYCAGIYDPNADYIATPTAHPYVIVEDAGVVGRFRLDDESAVWNGNGSFYPSDDAQRWSMITDLKEVFASVAFVEFGKLASAIFSGDYMLSQYGVEEGKASANYKNFLGYNEDGTPKGFDPNICIDFLNGRAIFKGDSLFQGTIKSANFFQNLDFITAASDGITHTSDSHRIDRTVSISDVMILSGDFGHCLTTIDDMQYHVAKGVYLTIPNANLEKFRGKQIRIVNNAWCKLLETTTGSYYFSSNVYVNADGGGMIYDMSLSFGANTLRAYWDSLNMNSQKISSMTLLSAPFDGSGLGQEWNWVIVDKKEMTSQEVRELKELY